MKRSIPVSCALLALASYLVAAWHAPLFMDEYSFQRNVAYFVQSRSIVPVFARYPPLYSYLIAPPIYAAFLVSYGLQGLPWAGLRDVALLKFLFVENVLVWTWVARLITMAFAAVTVGMTLRHAVRALTRVGVVAVAAMLLLDPFRLVTGLARYGLPDLPVACLVTAAMLLCLRYFESGRLRDLCISGLLVGLAGSMKVNGWFAIPAVCLAPWFTGRKEQRGAASMRALFSCVAGFVLGCPSLLFAWPAYVAELQVEKEVLFTGGHLGAHGRPWLWVFRDLWTANAGFALVSILAVGLAAIRRSREDRFFLALLLPAFIVFGALQKKTLIYFIVVYPMLALWVGRLADSARQRMVSQRERALAATALAVLIGVTAAGHARFLKRTLREDNTVLARRWIEARIPAGAGVLIDWAYVPTLRDTTEQARFMEEARAAKSPFAGWIEERQQQSPAYRLFRLLDLSYNPSRVDRAAAEYLVTSSGCYARFFPWNGGRVPAAEDPLYAKFTRRKLFYEKLFSGDTRFRLLKNVTEGSGSTVRIYGSERDLL